MSLRDPPPVKCNMIISPRSQWEEYICPDCDELMDDPIRTSCGHRMCHKCFAKRSKNIFFNAVFPLIFGSLCPVRDDGGQEHIMSRDDWNIRRDRTAEWKINKLLVKCDKCEVECTVKKYRSFSCSNAHEGIKSILISPRSQWEEYICPVCDKLMDDPVLTSCGHQMCYKCFDERMSYGKPWCPVRDDGGQEHEMSQDDWSRDTTAKWEINKLLVKCEKCKVECTVKRFRKFDCSTAHDAGINSILISARSQWEEYICPYCDELMDNPVQTSCGQRMCYKCFDKRRIFPLLVCFGPWCPVQEHKISRRNWSKDWTAEWKINKLLVKCEKCEVECTVKRYRKFDCSTAHAEIKSILISPRSQWEEYTCPDCDELMDDPVQTCCGHRLCFKCFNNRRENFQDRWCPVRDDDDDERHEMTWDYWYKDKAIGKKINKLLVKCPDCKVVCTMKEYKKFHSTSTITAMLSQEEIDGLCHFLVNDCKEDLPHWKQLLQDNKVITPSQLGVTNNKLFSKVLPNRNCTGIMAFHQCLKQCSCPRCKYLLRLWSDLSVADDDEVPTSDGQQRNHCLTADAVYTKLTNIKTFRELEKLPPDQQQELITQVLKKTLPAAKGSLSIDEIRPLLYQNGVITSEEATELLGIFTGEEKVTRLYTKMLPNKGLKGLKKFMRILYDTGWKTPSHMRHHGELSIKLSEKLSQIKSAESVLCQYKSEKAAIEAIIPMVYSESLKDAVINLSMNINKLLLLMVKKHIISISDYYWLRCACYRGRKLEYLYKEVLPQKGVKELKAFMEILQEVGRKTPKYHNHHDLLKSTLQTHLSKF